MDEWSKEDRDLIDAGRADSTMSDLQRAHLRTEMLARAAAAVPVPKLRLVKATAVAKGMAVVAVVAAAAVMFTHRERPVEQGAPVVAASAPVVAPVLEEPAPVAEVLAQPTGAPIGGRVRLAADLSADLQLLQRTQEALSRNAAATALALLDARPRRPASALEPELAASRVLALCALARQAEARNKARAFAARWPASPLRQRIDEACGAILR